MPYQLDTWRGWQMANLPIEFGTALSRAGTIPCRSV